jgi:hypothetical protein
MGGDMLTFDEALAELQMATHELRSLVAQGEVRAFRDEDVLKFRRTDILDLKKSRDTSEGGLVIHPTEIGDEMPTMAETDEVPAAGQPVRPAKHETEETELLTGIGKDVPTDFLGLDDTAVGGDMTGDTAQTVVPTIEIADEDMIDDTAQTVIPTFFSEERVSDYGIGDTAVPAPSLLAEEDEATEMATEEIRPDEIAPTAAVALEETAAAEEPLRFQDASDATATASELGISSDDVGTAGATAGLTRARRSQIYQEEAAGAPVSPLFLVLAIVTFVILLFGVPVFYAVATDSDLTMAPYKGLLEFLRQQAGS